MSAWILKYLVKAISLLLMVGFFEIAECATTYATVTATIIQPLSDISGLTLSARQLDMQGKKNGKIAVFNRSEIWREIRIELIPMSGNTAECDISYSPMTSSIPPGGHQVVRLLLRNGDNGSCKTDLRMDISDKHGMQLFSVPIYSMLD